MNTNIAIASLLFVISLFPDIAVGAPESVTYLPGNRAVYLTLCDPEASYYNQYVHYFHILFIPNYGHSYSPAATPGGGLVDGDTVELAPGTECQDVMIFTAGVTDADHDVIDIGSCYDFSSTGGLRSCLRSVGYYTLLASITPTISLVWSAPITIGNSVFETVTLSPSFATLTVAASCTQQNGAVVSVSPDSAGSNVTDDDGKAFFDIHTSVGTPVPGQAPSGTCTFSVPLATSGAAASVQIQGAVFQPTLAINPTSVVQPGSTPVVAQISPAYAHVSISTACSAFGATVTVTPSTRTTDASGHASFTVNAQNLVGIGGTPSASCTFHVVGGTGQATLSVSTGNACTYALQPAPPACGNP